MGSVPNNVDVYGSPALHTQTMLAFILGFFKIKKGKVIRVESQYVDDRFKRARN